MFSGIQQFYTVFQIADSFEVSHKTVRKWIRDGHLRRWRPDLHGRKYAVRVSAEELERFANGDPFPIKAPSAKRKTARQPTHKKRARNGGVI